MLIESLPTLKLLKVEKNSSSTSNEGAIYGLFIININIL